MKRLLIWNRLFLCMLLAGILLAGCAAKKSEPWGNETTGFILTYRSEAGAELKYDFTTDMTMIMDMMGQEMEMLIAMKGEILSRTKNIADDGSLTFGTGFNTLHVTTSSPQGEMEPDG